MNEPDYDKMLDKGNPYESPISGPYLDSFACNKCLEKFDILRDPDTDRLDDESAGKINEHTFHIRIVCAWCDDEMGYRTCDKKNDGLVSHSCCHDCAKKWNQSAMDIK